jgi:hypothetical protein
MDLSFQVKAAARQATSAGNPAPKKLADHPICGMAIAAAIFLVFCQRDFLDPAMETIEGLSAAWRAPSGVQPNLSIANLAIEENCL